jgi:vacuolar-type H+-ATPase subunit E/Vma4
MSLNAILEAIQESGLTEVAQIEAQAQNHVETILAKARAEAERIQRDCWATRMTQAKREETRVMLEARSQVLKIVGEANQTLIEETLTRTREQLANLRPASNYPAVLRHLTVEALDKLYLCLEDDERVCLRANNHDQELLEPFLGDRYPGMLVNYDLNCWGGIIAQSGDGCIVVINTLEERFERSRPHLQRHLAVWFEGDKNMQY